jgi:hypothetical protein
MGRSTQAYAMILIALSLAGCCKDYVEPPNEYRIALQELDTAWLAECQGLGDLPDRSVGTLLQDFVDLTKVATPCRADHNALVRYLGPLIQKAKGETDGNVRETKGGGD